MATINGSDNPNTLTGTADADVINAYMSADTVNAGAGNDVIVGDGIDTVLEGLGGTLGRIELSGQSGNDPRHLCLVQHHRGHDGQPGYPGRWRGG